MPIEVFLSCRTFRTGLVPMISQWVLVSQSCVSMEEDIPPSVAPPTCSENGTLSGRSLKNPSQPCLRKPEKERSQNQLISRLLWCCGFPLAAMLPQKMAAGVQPSSLKWLLGGGEESKEVLVQGGLVLGAELWLPSSERVQGWPQDLSWD